MPFSRSAAYYDDLYRTKGYTADCDFLELVFRRFSPRKPKTILDIACGTGRHARELIQRGYSVTGTDLSPQMITIARDKAAAAGVNADFYVADMQQLDVGRQFDAAVCMFASIGYLKDASAIENTMRVVKRHLNRGGLFIYDFWNAAAVPRQYSEFRLKRVTASTGAQVSRLSFTELHEPRHFCRIRHRVFVHRDGQLVDEFSEFHDLRFYDPQEMRRSAESCGLRVLDLLSMDSGRPADASTWSITMVAAAP